MRKLLLEQDNISNKLFLKSIIIPTLVGIVMLFISCDGSNIEKIKEITSEIDSPTQAVTNTEIIVSKNALIEVKIVSKQINRYVDIEEPYMEFPLGLHVEFYDSAQIVTSSIKANYCIYDITKELWTAENDVVAIGEKGDTLNTEFLIWDQKTDEIYSNTYVRLTNSDGIIHGTGFKTNQSFDPIEITNTSGEISVENEK